MEKSNIFKIKVNMYIANKEYLLISVGINNVSKTKDEEMYEMLEETLKNHKYTNIIVIGTPLKYENTKSNYTLNYTN